LSPRLFSVDANADFFLAYAKPGASTALTLIATIHDVSHILLLLLGSWAFG
jgi:hypothetical protein